MNRNERTLKLIRLYRTKEALWNMCSPIYRSWEAKQLAYREIGRILNMSPDEVKKKIKSIRSVYVAEKTRFDSRKQSGKIQKPKLAWYDEMAFLDEYIVPRKLRSDLDQHTDDSLTFEEFILEDDTPLFKQIQKEHENSSKMKEKCAEHKFDTSVNTTRTLIKLYREREMLWNMHSPLYKQSEAKQEAYHEIASIMNMSFEEVKRKIKSIRSVYVSEKTKVDASKQSGCASCEIYKPSLAWYHEMGFLDNCIIPRKIKSNSIQSSKHIQKCEDTLLSNNEEKSSDLLSESDLTTAEFSLDEHEQYKMRCGEIFLTTLGRVIFNCTLCDMKFIGYDLYKIHVDDHLFTELEDETLDTGNNEQGEEWELQPALLINSEVLGKDENETQNISFCGSDLNEENLSDETNSQTYFAEENWGYGNKTSFTVFDSMTHTSNDTDESLGCDYNKRVTLDELKGKTENFVIEKFKNKLNKIENSADDPQLYEMQIEAVRDVEKRCFSQSQFISEEERKHKCLVCNLGFKDRANMVHHLKRHTNKKDHKCSICGKEFYTSTECGVHKRSHTNERPFLCNICGKSYVYSVQLMEHLRRHGPDKPYKCEICDKAFYDKTDLTDHMVCHSMEKPFLCDLCPTRFSRQAALRNHKKLHENNKEYKCRMCSSSFNQRAGLFSHMKSHQIERIRLNNAGFSS